jgi:Ala-tRNA(Pro) deacylase
MSDALFALLRDRGIPYGRCDHPPVFTTAEAERLVPPLPGAKAKNLFLRAAPSGRRLLVVVPYAKRVDLGGLAQALGARKLAFASADELLACLGITPGAVSLLALVHDAAHAVDVVIDEALWHADGLQCHPLVNTSTLSLSADGVRRFLAATGHVPRVLDVPSRPRAA